MVVLMTRVQKIEREIEELGPKELAELRRWFAEYDNARWDDQIEADARAGRLDALATDALDAHRRGETREL